MSIKALLDAGLFLSLNYVIIKVYITESEGFTMPYDDATAYGYTREEYARDMEEELLRYEADHLEKWIVEDHDTSENISRPFRTKWIKEYYAYLVNANEVTLGKIFDMDVYPYGFRMKIGDLVKNVPDIDKCTKDSVDQSYMELVGLVNIVNNEIDYIKHMAYDKAVKVKLNRSCGEGYVILPEFKAKLLEEMGLGEIEKEKRNIDR